MVAKAGFVVIGLGAVGIGGVAVAKPHLLGMDYMPEFHALSKDHDFSSAGYSNKLGNKFKNYLVGVTNKTSGDDNTSNRTWWEWAFRKLQREGVSSGKFQVKDKDKKVDKPYGGNNDATALNQVCKKAYQEDASNESDVWKYCSPLGKEPSKIKDNEYRGKIGESIKSEAISVKDKENDMFWTIREKEVQGKDNNFEKVPSAGITEGHFNNRSLPMKELCRKAYEAQTGSSVGTPNADDAKKYCKFEIS